MNKYLIVCPQDSTTTFLQGIFNDLPNKTVITGGITKTQLRKYILNHDHCIFCGHGSSSGLFSVGQFPDGPYIIDDSMVESLRNKTNLFIWCDSDVFVHRHGLTGFHTGMFLSQMSECVCFGVKCTEEDINESNYGFAEIVGRYINEPPIIFYKNVLIEYGRLAQKNPVTRYNHSRLYLNRFEPVMFADIVNNLN
jgi:hypothetical protein